MNAICRFIPSTRTSENIHIINFVREEHLAAMSYPKTNPVYRIYYVVNGTGEIQCECERHAVKKGDIFFIFPATSYDIIACEAFEYMYISFVGSRANLEMERIGVNKKNFVFEDYLELYSLWTEGISQSSEMIDLTSESILLYSFLKIGSRTIYKEKETIQSVSMNNGSLLKKYIDDHLSDPDLSLEKMSEHFSYSPNYISSLFKKYFRIGFAEYIKEMRINHACSLIESGHTSVAYLAEMCGFNDALYFSKVFKQKVGMPPKKYIVHWEQTQ